MQSAILWFGGKGRMAPKLISLMPEHRTYVEPFGGGASLLHAKPPSPVEVYNDIDEGLVNFWRVLRDPAQFEALHRLVSLTPYSRQEFEESVQGWLTETDPIQKAHKWFIRVRQGFSGDMRYGGWSYCRGESSAGMARSASRWLAAIDRLPEIHQRWMAVQIEHDDWRTVMDRFDTPQTLFYCDPPYVLATRSRTRYRYEITLSDHEDLVQRLLHLKGKCILSGYLHPVYEPLEAAGWQRLTFDTHAYAAGRTRQTGILGPGASTEHLRRVEVVWLSHPVAPDQLRFFC